MILTVRSLGNQATSNSLTVHTYIDINSEEAWVQDTLTYVTVQVHTMILTMRRPGNLTVNINSVLYLYSHNDINSEEAWEQDYL